MIYISSIKKNAHFRVFVLCHTRRACTGNAAPLTPAPAGPTSIIAGPTKHSCDVFTVAAAAAPPPFAAAPAPAELAPEEPPPALVVLL